LTDLKIVTNLAWPAFRNVALDLKKVLSARYDVSVLNYSDATPGGRVIVVDTVKDSTFKFIANKLKGSDVVLYGPTEGHSIIDADSRETAKNIKIVAVSGFVKGLLEDVGLRVAGVIPHGVDVSFRDVDKEYEEKVKGIIDGRLMILTIASNDVRKGIPELLEAYKFVEKAVPHSFLVLHSEPRTYFNEVEKKVKERFCDPLELSASMGIERIWNTCSHGVLTAEQVNALYDCCCIYVSSSKSEGFGLPLIEAYRFNKPVVAVNAPPFNELVEDGVTGSMFDYSRIEWFNYMDSIRFKLHSYKPERLAEKIVSLLLTPEIRENMSRTICEAKWRWDIRTVYPKFLDYF